VADVVALFAAQLVITFPSAINFTFPAVLTVAVIVTTVPFEATTAPPVRANVIVAEPPVPAVIVKVYVSVSEPAKLLAVNIITRAVTVSVGVPEI
jgi:hypothetical protein